MARQMGARRVEKQAEPRSPDTSATLNVDGSVLGWLKAPVELNIEIVVVDGVTIRIASAIDTHPAFARATRRLNGQSGRAHREFRLAAKEHKLTGRISKGQTISHPHTSVPIIGVQSGDHSPSTRVRAFLAIAGPREDPVYIHAANCSAIEDGKILSALEDARYNRSERTSRN